MSIIKGGHSALLDYRAHFLASADVVAERLRGYHNSASRGHRLQRMNKCIRTCSLNTIEPIIICRNTKFVNNFDNVAKQASSPDNEQRNNYKRRRLTFSCGTSNYNFAISD